MPRDSSRVADALDFWRQLQRFYRERASSWWWSWSRASTESTVRCWRTRDQGSPPTPISMTWASGLRSSGINVINLKETMERAARDGLRDYDDACNRATTRIGMPLVSSWRHRRLRLGSSS